MSINAAHIQVYASASMPTTDNEQSGGVINSGIRITFTDISATDDIELVSDDANDTQEWIIIGRNAGGSIISETGNLSGTTVVTTTATFERILRMTVDSLPTGIITVRKESDNVTIGQMSGQITGIFRPFYNAVANPTTERTNDVYEKVFIRNDHLTLNLLSATVQELSSGVYERVEFTLEDAVNDNNSVTGRLNTVPAGNNEAFSSDTKAVPGTNLDAGDAIGVWLKLNLPSGQAANEDNYVLRVNGNTT